jgi:hypothetical protein
MPRRSHLILPFLLLLVGCGPVKVQETNPVGQHKTECRAILKALPEKLDGHARVETTGSKYAVAWGDPAVVLRCGVDKPSDFDETLGCQGANGIMWFVPSRVIDDQGADVLMTSIGRSTNVEVLVPVERRPPADEMIDIGSVLAKTTTKVSDCK